MRRFEMYIGAGTLAQGIAKSKDIALMWDTTVFEDSKWILWIKDCHYCAIHYITIVLFPILRYDLKFTYVTLLDRNLFHMPQRSPLWHMKWL